MTRTPELDVAIVGSGFAGLCMGEVERRHARAVDVRPSAQASYNAALQPRLERSVWQSGCKSWYLATSGKNTTLWPGFTIEFWLRTLRLDPDAYVFE